jgi:hypothetical protein
VLSTRCTPLSCVRSPPSVRGWLIQASEWSHVIVRVVVVPVVGVVLASWVTAALTGGGESPCQCVTVGRVALPTSTPA